MPQPRTHSLRIYLYRGLGCIGLGFVLATAVLRGFVEGRIQDQADAQVRSLRRYRDQQALLLVLMNEDVGLRSYLGTGNFSFLVAFYQSGKDESSAIRTILENLQDSDRKEAHERIDQLVFRLREWHRRVAGPLIKAREQGPLADPKTDLEREKEWFDSVTEAIAFLGRDLDAQDEKRLRDLDRALRLARWIELVTYGGLLLSVFALSRLILRKVAEPLSDLAERARTRAGFPEPWTRRTIKEVDILGSALYELDLRSREREKILEERSLRDSLTGTYNRAFLDAFLPKIADQAKRKGFPFSLLMLDIDHFKRFNDEFGHEAGDHVLRAFAQCLQDHVRKGDVVARYGGEEFAVFLPHAGPDLAVVLAERLRQAIQDLPLPAPPFPPGRRITASIGVASHPDHSGALDTLVSLADQALYQAKDRGRNCVFSAGDLPEPG
jgi:diguanylate cyclase (GGDEF)-like protein